METTPVVVDGILYAGSRDSYLYALDSASGELVWRYKTGGAVWSSPTVADGIVYIGSDDRHLHAVDAASGEALWTFKAGVIQGVTFSGTHEIRSTPVVDGGHVYFTAKGRLYALDALKGELRWQVMPGTHARSSPAAADGIVYVGGGERDVYALDGASGEEIWRFTTNGRIDTRPAVAEGVVYVNTYSYSYDGDGRLYALDAASGAQLWSSGISGMDWNPVVSGGGVYVSGYSGLYAFDAASGEPLPNYPVRPGDSSALAVAEGVVYAGKLYALDGASGEVLWKHVIEEDMYDSYIGGPPAVADGVVYVGSSDGKIYALAPRSRRVHQERRSRLRRMENRGMSPSLPCGDSGPATAWTLQPRWWMAWSISAQGIPITTTAVP